MEVSVTWRGVPIIGRTCKIQSTPNLSLHLRMLRRALLVGLAVLCSLSWASAGRGQAGRGNGNPEDVVKPVARTRQERKRDLKHCLAGSAAGHELSSRNILPGTKVTVSGLENAVELNGKKGVALRWREGGRWTVSVAGKEVDMKVFTPPPPSPHNLTTLQGKHALRPPTPSPHHVPTSQGKHALRAGLFSDGGPALFSGGQPLGTKRDGRPSCFRRSHGGGRKTAANVGRHQKGHVSRVSVVL